MAKKKKITEIARSVGMSPREVMEHFEKIGITVKSTRSNVDEEDYQALLKHLGFEVEKEKKVERRTVIRRRRAPTPAAPEEKIEVPEEKKAEEVSEEQKEEAVTETVQEETHAEQQQVAEKPAAVEEETPKPKETKEEITEEAPVESIPSQIPPLTPEEEQRRKEEKAKKRKELPEEEKILRKKVIKRREILTREDLYTEEERSRFQVRKKIPPKRPVKKPTITVPKEEKRIIKVEKSIEVAELAQRLGAKVNEVLAKLRDLGVEADRNTLIDFEAAALVAADYNFTVEKEEFRPEDHFDIGPSDPEKLRPRAPVVTVMGHVDHGKTSILDAIRRTNVAAGEAGGITQRIGASVVETPKGTITFIDTPGHEAFTTMRARGAQVTDIVILVVAADDGVMPQTVEAINHARAAGVPIVVAINKVDKPNANVEAVKKGLAEHELIPEEWGGETLFVETSAIKGQGIQELLEAVLLVAEMHELKADPSKRAHAIIIESRLDKGRGPVASVVVREGTLKVGDWVVAGTAFGRVRSLIDWTGKNVKSAGPSVPVEVVGLSEVPEAGEHLYAVKNEDIARRIAEFYKQQREAAKGEVVTPEKVTLESLFQKISEGELKHFNLVIKADYLGSVEAIENAVKRLSTNEVQVEVVHKGVGAITESDVMLASASNAVVVGFNVKPDPRAKEAAKKEKVQIKTYEVIYELLEDVEKAVKGLLAPEVEVVQIGAAEVKQVFRISSVGVVAGCLVTDGRVRRNSKVKILRNGEQVGEGIVSSLKRFKEDVREVTKGFECGIGVDGFNDFEEGDRLEFYEEVSKEATA